MRVWGLGKTALCQIPIGEMVVIYSNKPLSFFTLNYLINKQGGYVVFSLLSEYSCTVYAFFKLHTPKSKQGPLQHQWLWDLSLSLEKFRRWLCSTKFRNDCVPPYFRAWLLGSWKLEKIETSQKSDYSFFSNFHGPGVMKLHKNQTLHFSWIFMTLSLSTWNFTKIKHFIVLEFSWRPVSVFSNFHYPRYMKFHKNQNLQFSQIFMAPGLWNFTKVRLFIFLEFSWPWCMKLHKNQTLQFSWNFMATGLWNFTKIRLTIFLEFSWPPVHETSQKSDASVF